MIGRGSLQVGQGCWWRRDRAALLPRKLGEGRDAPHVRPPGEARRSAGGLGEGVGERECRRCRCRRAGTRVSPSARRAWSAASESVGGRSPRTMWSAARWACQGPETAPIWRHTRRPKRSPRRSPASTRSWTTIRPDGRSQSRSWPRDLRMRKARPGGSRRSSRPWDAERAHNIRRSAPVRRRSRGCARAGSAGPHPIRIEVDGTQVGLPLRLTDRQVAERGGESAL